MPRAPDEECAQEAEREEGESESPEKQTWRRNRNLRWRGGLGNDGGMGQWEIGRPSGCLSAYMENRKVMAFRDFHDDRFSGAFLRKIGRELLPQDARVGSHDAVFAGVVAGMSTEDADPNLLLGGVFGSFPNCAFSYVKQELAEAGGRLQVLA